MGDPVGSLKKVSLPNRKRGRLTAYRDSDQLIVLFTQEEGADRIRSLQRITFARQVGLEEQMQTSLQGIAKKGTNYFEFLGFEFRWGTSRKGKDIIKRRTSRKKLLSSLKKFTLWCRKCRNFRLRKIFKLLNAKLRGYYNYYGVIGNFASLQKFFFRAMRILYKWLNRRSQKRSFCYNIFNQITKFYNIEKPRITEIYQPV